MPIERKPPSQHDMTKFKVDEPRKPVEKPQARRALHEMKVREVSKALTDAHTRATLIEAAVKSGKPDMGGGVQVRIFRDSKGRNMAKITHTYRNFFGITRTSEMLVDAAGNKIA